MLAKKINKQQGEDIFEITCDCGSVFSTLVWRITGKKVCPTCNKEVRKVLLNQL